MSEVRYSVNGKYFKDFGIYISSSKGLFDALKRKKVNTYDWAEYHGSSPDLSNPKFEQREISLKGFVTGANWEEMKSNFDAIISEFQKAGTQRLLIEPFGLKPLPYEVCMIDDVNLNKTFKDGKMVGVFTLKLIEPNPLKIVLYTNESTLNLSYNSPQETEIFYGNGLKDIVKTNASLSGKTLTNRVLSGYNFNGRNLLKNSTFKNDIQSWGTNKNPYYDFRYNGIFLETNSGNSGIYQIISNNYSGTIIASFDVMFEIYEPIQNLIDFGIEGVFMKSLGYQDIKYREWVKVTATFPISTIGNLAFHIFSQTNNRTSYTVRNIKLEKGNKATDWTPAPEDEKHIIIAGNVDEITNLTTNADILWE